jgi:hypothetical protein
MTDNDINEIIILWIILIPPLCVFIGAALLVIL